MKLNDNQRAFLDAARDGGVSARAPEREALTDPEIREMEAAGIVVGERRMFTLAGQSTPSIYGWRAA